MKKVYRAYGTIISLVAYVDGKNVPVNFSPVSNYYPGNGGSMFVTEDEKLQAALESMKPMFGRTFFLVQDEKPIVEEKPAEEEKKELKVINVNGFEDAKTWLVDHCDWKPTARPTKASVMKVAESYGYKFEGLK